MEGEVGSVGLLPDADDLASLISIEGLRIMPSPSPRSRRRPQKPDPDRAAKLVLTGVACVAYFGLGGLVGVTGPSVPALALTFHVPETRLGAAFTCRGSGYLAGSVLSSWAEKRMGKRYLLGMSLFLAGGVTLLAAWLPYMGAFLALMLVQGVGLGGVDVTGNALLVELWGTTVDAYMQGMHAAFGLGAVVSPLVVGRGGYRTGFSVFGLLGLGPLLLIAMEDAVLHCRRRRAQKEEMQDYVEDEEAEEEGAEREGKAEMLGPIPRRVGVVMSVFLLVYVGIEVGFGGWVSTVLLRQGLVGDMGRAAYGVSWFWGAITGGRLLAVLVAVVLSPRPFLLLQLLLTVCGSLLYLLLGSRSLLLSTATSVLFGLGLSSIFPLMMTLPGALGLRLDMQWTSAFLVGSTVGEALLPLCIGLGMELQGEAALGYWAFGCSVAMLLLLGLIVLLAPRPPPTPKVATPVKKGGEEGGGEGGREKADGPNSVGGSSRSSERLSGMGRRRSAGSANSEGSRVFSADMLMALLAQDQAMRVEGLKEERGVREEEEEAAGEEEGGAGLA